MRAARTVWADGVWAMGMSAMAASLLVGCLVTEKIEFQEENTFPPSIESRPMAEHPISSIITLDLRDGDGQGNGDGQTEVVLEVNVRDPDVFQSLERRVYLANDCRPYEFLIPPGGTTNDPTVRPVDQRVLRSDIERSAGGTGNRCVRIEMRVSGEFMSGSPLPVRDGDVGTAVWWVYLHETDPFEIDPTRCTSGSIDELCSN